MKKSEREHALKLIQFLETEVESLRMNNNLLRMDLRHEAERMAENMMAEYTLSLRAANRERDELRREFKIFRESVQKTPKEPRPKKQTNHAAHLLPEIIKTYEEELRRLGSPLMEGRE